MPYVVCKLQPSNTQGFNVNLSPNNRYICIFIWCLNSAPNQSPNQPKHNPWSYMSTQQITFDLFWITQNKLKKDKKVEKMSFYIRGTITYSYAWCSDKVLFSFDDDVILQLGTDLFTLEDFFHDIALRSNLLKEGEDDMNQVKSNFHLKISASQFCEITHISQIVHHNKLNFYREILDIWNYILIYFQVKWSSVTYYFRWSRLLDKSYQIC